MDHATQQFTNTRAFLSTLPALTAIAEAINQGRKIGIEVTATIVAPTLEVIAVASADNATPHSRETSRRKAQTAASTRRATGWMPAGLAVELPLATGGLLTNVPGGVPIKVDGVIVAGLGIAGGTVEQDAQIADAVLTVLGFDLS